MALEDAFNEHLGDQPDYPVNPVDTARRDRDLIEDAVRGMRITELGEKYRLTPTQVTRILNAAAVQVREDAASLVERAFHNQVERLERLYALVELELQDYETWMLAKRAGRGDKATPVKFDDRPFRIAVSIFERQAKLLGLDRNTRNTTGAAGWLENAPIDQVVDYAKQLKMNLPSPFET